MPVGLRGHGRRTVAAQRMTGSGRFSPLADEIHPWTLNGDFRPEGDVRRRGFMCLHLDHEPVISEQK